MERSETDVCGFYGLTVVVPSRKTVLISGHGVFLYGPVMSTDFLDTGTKVNDWRRRLTYQSLQAHGDTFFFSFSSPLSLWGLMSQRRRVTSFSSIIHP